MEKKRFNFKITPSIIFLSIANLFPIYGVLFLGWEVFIILFLFWMENLIIGFFNILRMLVVSPENPIKWLAKLFLIPFFTFHYGMFTMIHGLFVIFLFGGENIKSGLPDVNLIMHIITKYHLTFAALALFLSHGFSFLYNYIGKFEYQKVSLQQLMGKPYARIVVLHLVIIFGGFLLMALKSPLAGLLLLVVLKIIFDLRSHIREHAKLKK